MNFHVPLEQKQYLGFACTPEGPNLFAAGRIFHIQAMPIKLTVPTLLFMDLGAQMGWKAFPHLHGGSGRAPHLETLCQELPKCFHGQCLPV